MNTSASARILAIDDSPEILRVVERTLSERFECRLAGDVPEARDRLAAEDFDLVLCDIQLPGESGLELVEEMRSDRSGTAVVLITGMDDPGVVNRALELGVHGYLVKPFWPGQLLITAQTALRRRSLEAAERHRRRTFEEQIQAAMNRAPVPIYVKNLDCRYVLANEVSHEVLGLEPGEMIGKTDAEMLPPESARLVEETDRRVLSNAESFEREETLRIGQSERTFLTVKFPYFDDNGSLAGVSGVSTEITAKREAEQLQRDLAAAQERAIEELQSSRQETVERLARAIEMHDAETGRHVNRMARIASYLGSQMGLSDEQIMLLRAAAPMHDVGKIATPEDILRKPGALTPEERVEMERHTEVGHRILADSESELLQMAARIALTHHEWFDGSGYPRGLKGEEIPIEGRIVAVADVFDALLSDRSYRPAMSVDEALDVIRKGSGTHFDPEVVEVLFENLDEAIDLRG
ncbi:MAG: PAS domain-containing protein [Actinomycetota bacterium]|nr:PAS domain-containing protein [Actinomycetota bacterium]